MLPVLSQAEADLTACFAQDISALLESFSEKDTSGKQSLQQMLSSDRAAFSRGSIRALANAAGSAGARYLLHLLRKNSLLIEALADHRGSKREDVVKAARVIAQAGAPIDAELERVLSSALSEPASADNSARVLRLLDVLEVASAQPRFYLFQSELMGHPDRAVRSRSTLLLARSGKSTALVGRMLLDEDVQVQANAVEALWTFDAGEAHPLLLNAGRSKNAHVAGNAAVGLYRVGDLSGVRLLFSMAEESDAERRASAAWAMGETGDARFLPFLTAWFTRSSGTERVNVLQALGRIRRREKSLAETGQIEIRTWSARMDAKADGQAANAARRLTLSLWSPDKTDLSRLKLTDFAIWEGETLVQDYEISAQQSPALAISGFVLPRFSSAADSYAIAVLDAIERCLKYKRADDLWRLDRYMTDPRMGGSGRPAEKAALPYDESLLGALGKTQQRGFLSAAEALRKIAESPGPRERAADDAIAAFERQSEAMIKFSGKRTLFLFLAPNCTDRLERHMARLTSLAGDDRITLHGIAPRISEHVAAGCEEFRGICMASEGGTFAVLAPEEVPAEVERIYWQSINRIDVTYRVPPQSKPAAGTVQVTSNSGCGRASFSF